ncbi:MAG: hypothetical protein KatS3mg090_0795 [Patescibacteria group bacterium]|nr:MAG: hypothetical protein KatS3mg090_0795 [Patescibacteria group bacterium]
MADRKKVKKIIIDANYLAQLSNLKLSANEKSRLEQDLNNTLDFVKNIQQFEFNQTNTVDSLVQNKMFADGKKTL